MGLSTAEAAYLAGLLDGEGCFTFMRQGSGRARASIWLPMIEILAQREALVAEIRLLNRRGR